jgi:hypothetical protein
MNAMNFCVYCLCHIDCVYVFYVGHVDRIVYMKPFSTKNVIIILIIIVVGILSAHLLSSYTIIIK